MSATTAAPRSASKGIATKVNDAATMALQWAKLLASKAITAAKGGWTFAWSFASRAVRKNAFGISMGAALLLASEKGYKALIKAITGTVKVAAKAGIGLLHGISKAVGFVGTGIAKLVGKVSASAGKWVQGTTWTITGAITSGTDWFRNLSDTVTTKFTVAAVSSFTTKTVNYVSMGFFGLLAANAVTGGAIATSVASLPVLGGIAASLVSGGLVTLAALGAVAVAGIAYTLMFKAEEAQNEADAEEIDALDADSLAKFEEAEQLRAATRAGKRLAQAQAALA